MYFRQISEQSFIIYFKAEISESVYEHVNAVVEHIQKDEPSAHT
ncbi:hypothetical protein JPSP7_09370 [Staphylococcus pseudintermedius]